VLHLQWSTLVFQLLNFFVLLAVLARFLYRPLMDAMQRREQAIAGRLAQADERAKCADAERAGLAETARTTQAEAEATLASARRDAAQLRETAQRDARVEASRLLDDARRRIADEEHAAQERLAAAARRSAVAVATTLIDRVAGPAFHEALVSRLLDAGLGLDPAKAETLRRAWQHGRSTVVVETARPLPAEAVARLEEALAKMLQPDGEILRPTVKIEPALVAGLRIVVGVGVVDLSLPRLLADLEPDGAA
jgi:F-type H+-transporting ATPase subunit b